MGLESISVCDQLEESRRQFRKPLCILISYQLISFAFLFKCIYMNIIHLNLVIFKSKVVVKS